MVDIDVEFINDGGLKYIHARRNDDNDLVFYLETTDNLVFGTWTNEAYTSVIGTYEPGGPCDYITNSVPTTGDKKFIRLKVEN